jgi:hypothetical protein
MGDERRRAREMEISLCHVKKEQEEAPSEENGRDPRGRGERYSSPKEGVGTPYWPGRGKPQRKKK